MTTMPTRALTWAIFATAAGIVAVICAAILRPFAHVIAWAATLAILRAAKQTYRIVSSTIADVPRHET